MAEEVYRTTRPDFISNTRWGAIFAGTFAALAVWATFGMLGLAIFANNANANANRPLTGMTWGEGAWIIVLSMVALYVGGRVTSALVDAENRGDSIIHGFVMFGLSTFTAILITTMIAGTTPGASSVPVGNTHNPGLLYAISTGGWIIFISLILSMCTAIWGSMHNAPKMGRRPETQSPDIRRVA
jgi:hypothetical protein